MHTYAAESTLPNAGWGLFADRLIGPDSSIDYGHVIGEYFGRILTEEDIKAYILEPNPSVNTGFMIFFQGLAIDAWDHINGTYICMAALTNDCLDVKRYNTEWVKKSITGKPTLYQEAYRNVDANEEFFVEYGNLAFCRAGFPTDILFQAISHYYPQIVVSSHDRELWSRIPQARYLFNSPYHTLQPSQLPQAIKLLQHHHSHCAIRCICDLQQQLQLFYTPTDTKKRTLPRLSLPPNRRKSSITSIPIPDSNNLRYDQRLLVQPDSTLPNAGLGLFATASIKKGEIIGIYENYSGGKRLTAARIKRPSHRSAYAVEHNGLVRDAWNPDLNQPCCKLAYSNDSMDPAKDNATLGVNPNFPMSLLFIATQDIDADPAHTLPIYLPYGGKYWCDDIYPIELQAQAIRRYSIDIYTSTEDTDGDWTALRNFPQLSQLFPPSYYATSSNPTAASSTTVTLAFPEATTVFDTKRSNPSPRIVKDARQRTIDGYIIQQTLARDPQEGVSNSQSHPVVNSTTTLALFPSTSTTTLTLALPEATTASDKKRSLTSPRIVKDARQRTIDGYIMQRTLVQDPQEGVSNSQSNTVVNSITTLALFSSTSTTQLDLQASEATLVIPPSDKKRLPPPSSIIKNARQRTMESYITKQTLATDTKAGVSNSTCYDVSAFDVLPAALNSNHLYIDNLHSPPPSVNSTSIVNSTLTSHSSPTLDHDKRDVFI